MTEPMTMSKRSRLTQKIEKEADRAAARLGASHVVIIAFFQDGEGVHMLEAGIRYDLACLFYCWRSGVFIDCFDRQLLGQLLRKLRCGMGPRNRARWLPPHGPTRRQSGQAIHPTRLRLERQVSLDSRIPAVASGPLNHRGRGSGLGWKGRQVVFRQAAFQCP
jgi:hypothetical protein